MTRNSAVFALFNALGFGALIACSTGFGSSERTGMVRQGLGEAGESVLVEMDASTFAAPASVSVTWAALPGNQYDWIAISPSGSPAGSYATYIYTNGAAAGSTTFANVGAGTWVARAYRNNTFEILDESPPFVVSGPEAGATTVSANQTTYQSSQTATITYSGMQGNQYDWISIAPQGSPNTAFTLWTYTNGQVSGTANFPLTGLNGTYVARAYFNNSYNIAAESQPFTVGTFISTDHAAYPSAPANVVVTFSNLPGNALDWITISPSGSPPTSYGQYAYTGGQTAGQRTLSVTSAGTYVARAYTNDSFNILYESAPFTVGGGGDAGSSATVSTNQATYTTSDNITVQFAGAPGNAADWVTISPAGSPATTYGQYFYTGGAASGSLDFSPLAAGSYEARLYVNDSFNVIATSTSFTVTAGGGGSDGGAPGVSTGAGPFTAPATVSVDFTNLPGNQYDWIALSPANGTPGEYIAYRYTNGATSGSYQFTNVPAGTYVARAYLNNTFTILAESTPSFTVNP
jgi:hypothetical protein